jgi:pimeloyl-ACP methyl ester carboxylesterase
MDQVMHGNRLSSGDPATLFFNFQNPLASRANVMQAALEDYQLVRLAAAFDVVERHHGGRTIRFDENKLYFFGHSQGSVTGIPFASHEPLVKGAVFSGAGGLLYLTMLSKTEPFDVTAVLALIIRDPEIDRFHPALSILQAFYEPADAIVYARLLVATPPLGNTAKHIFQPLGFNDSYTPVPTIEALATALGSDLLAPKLQSIAGLDLLEKRVLSPPVSGNAGGVTSIVAQYEPAAGSDGHFVSFDLVAARKQTTQFIKTLVETGLATVVAP